MPGETKTLYCVRHGRARQREARREEERRRGAVADVPRQVLEPVLLALPEPFFFFKCILIFLQQYYCVLVELLHGLLHPTSQTIVQPMNDNEIFCNS